MFYLFSLGILVYMILVASREGGGAALRKSFILVALLGPTWMTYNLRSIRLDFRIVQAVLAIAILLAFPPKRPLVFRLSLTDVLVLARFFSLCISQYLSGALAPLTAFDIAGTWLSTYVVGRVFVQSPEDLKELGRVAAGMLAVVCVLALVEALSKMNPVNTLLGKRFGILESGEGYRWGMKRAQGNVSHPIYNGFQLILFLPFALQLVREGWQWESKRWLALLSPLFLGITIFVTVSRGAQLGYCIAAGFAVFLLKPRLRIPLVIIAVSSAVFLYSVKDVLVEQLGKMAGENTEEARIIMIDGEEVEYTGTKHRLLLLQVYRGPLEQAGLFGWGGALSGVQIDPELAQRFGSIDSHYVLFYLQYGRIGSYLFVAIMLTVIFNMTWVAWNPSAWQPWAAGIAAAFVSIGISMSSVWFAPDYAAIWLFVAGLAGNVKSIWQNKALRFESEQLGCTLSDVAQRCVGWALPGRSLVPVTQVPVTQVSVAQATVTHAAGAFS